MNDDPCHRDPGITAPAAGADSAILPDGGTSSLRPAEEQRVAYCTEPGFGVLEVAGSDAESFLQGQLSSDLRALQPGSAHYSSYNTAKGRMLANLLVLRPPDEPSFRYVVLLALDLAAAVRERLARYVMRAKVTLVNRSSEWAVLGLAGGHVIPGEAAAEAAPLAVRVAAGALVVVLPDGRTLATGPRDAMAVLDRRLASDATSISRDAWLRTDVDAGVAWVVSATSDRFVPQMLNWDVLGGISFRKGCYPGQEIVARMQYLGKLKERLLAFATDAGDVRPGATLRSGAFGDQSCGTVAVAATGETGGTRFLAVTQLAAAAAGDLRLADAPAARLTQLPLPYALPAPQA